MRKKNSYYDCSTGDTNQPGLLGSGMPLNCSVRSSTIRAVEWWYS